MILLIREKVRVFEGRKPEFSLRGFISLNISDADDIKRFRRLYRYIPRYVLNIVDLQSG